MRTAERWLVLEAGTHCVELQPAACSAAAAAAPAAPACCRRRAGASPAAARPPACAPRPAAAVGYAAFVGSMRLAQRLSPLSSGYRALPTAQQLEWCNRAPSTLHAVAITAATAWLFLASPVFSEDHVSWRGASAA